MFEISESAASDENRAFDAFAMRDGKQKFVFTDAADKRPAGFYSGWKTVRDSRRKSALDVHLDQDTRVYSADIFQSVKKSAAYICSEKRVGRNRFAKQRLGKRTMRKRRDIGSPARPRKIKIKINAL